jgi:hypothetical protein
MNNQLDRYTQRREACTLPDGTRPYAWWKQYQRRISYAKTMSDAEIQREAAYIAKAQAAALGENE